MHSLFNNYTVLGDDPLDHRSRFARSLGFYDDGTSVAHTPPAEGIDASMIMAAEEEDAPYEKSYGSSEDVESVAASLTRALDLEHSLSASASDDNSNSNGVGLPVPPSIEKVGDNTDIKPSSSTEEVPIIISPEH